MTASAPTPEEQVRFLQNVQRLLAEGRFVASYKFALLHAIADLAVLKGDDSGASLDLATKDIAAKFVELYWRQCRPFPTGDEKAGLVLQQNTGKQASIIWHIGEAQQKWSSVYRFKQAAAGQWSELVKEVNEVVRTMPLWKLQTVGKEKLKFLYDDEGHGTRITLKPGVAYCLRAFYELLRNLIQGAWVRFVQKLNGKLGKDGRIDDLGTFLFGQERGDLSDYRDILVDVQQGICMYCQKPLPAQPQVDHFIPWARYPADLGQNFVLAHPTCNNAKSDHVAAENHLKAWADRNRAHGQMLQARLEEKGLPCDWPASIQIAKWVYEQTDKVKGQVWVAGKVLQPLDPAWRVCLPA